MMNAMTYRGYTARVEFDPRDNIFWGKVDPRGRVFVRAKSQLCNRRDLSRHVWLLRDRAQRQLAADEPFQAVRRFEQQRAVLGDARRPARYRVAIA